MVQETTKGEVWKAKSRRQRGLGSQHWGKDIAAVSLDALLNRRRIRRPGTSSLATEDDASGNHAFLPESNTTRKGDWCGVLPTIRGWGVASSYPASPDTQRHQSQILPKVIGRFQYNSHQNPTEVFCVVIDKLIIKFIWKDKGPRIVESIWWKRSIK